MRVAAVLFAGVFAGGCTVGPNYQRPQIDVPTAYRYAEPAAQAIADIEWWEGFGDPVLSDLVREALRNNLDVRIAAARVDIFLGTLATTRSALFPQVAVAPTFPIEAARQRGSRLATPQKVPSDTTIEFATYRAGISASWEIDLWGKVRRQTESATADVFANEEARRGVVLSVAAATASGYIALRDLDRQLDIARETARSRGDSLELFQKRFAGGVVSQLEVAQVTSEFESALSTIPPIETEIALQEQALSLLLGRNPGPIPRGKSIDQLKPIVIPEGLPSELLERRPDIRQAEQQLIAANAQIGAAKALYFPSISLTGVFGAASTALGDLFTGPARTWSFAAGLTTPIFNAGAIAGQVQQAEAGQRLALANYSKTVQAAFGDVENALITAEKARATQAALQRTVAALADYARLARLRYDNGYTSYIEVLDAERSLFEAQLSYAHSQNTALAAQVAIYKAMGGGWIDAADRLTPVGAAAPLDKRVADQPMF
ncbi:MAG TPA: efflux transporter outer membrane subunit [Casimicrobiaceae bacterium]